MTIPAAYFDGVHPRRHRVTLQFDAGAVRLDGEHAHRVEPLRTIRFSERLDHAPRLVHFDDGAYCEVADHAALDRALAALGNRGGLVERWQRRWRWVLVALVGTVVACVLGYRVAVPIAADRIARALPPSAERALGDRALRSLDGQWFGPSHLAQADQRRVIEGFARIVAARPDPVEFRIVFRSSTIGPNAFALPGGTIVVTDALVALAGDDRALMGVLAHEHGHVARHHAMRMLVQSAVVGAAVGLFIGDVSGFATAIPATLLELKYSRDFEREADDEAIAALRAAGVSPAPMADLLERMQHARDGAHGSEPTADYFSSHPATSERIAHLRAAAR